MVRQQAAAREWARGFHDRIGAPASAYAVCGPGSEPWSAAFGLADLEFAVPALPSHPFRIGSVSKVITTTVVAKLVSQRLLDLDGPIARWLPDLPAPHRQTSMRQLLTHRGGIRHYLPKDLDPDRPGGPIFTRARWTADDILAAFIHDELVAPPGERVSYSSWGYSLASLVMEAAANRPFTELIDAEIAKPFAMASLVPDRPDRVIPGRVRGYAGAQERAMMRAQFPQAGFAEVADEWTRAPHNNPAYCWAGAGYLANMPDLARFGAALLDGPGSGITHDERALLFTPSTERCDASPPLGLGWRVDEDASGRLRWHHAGGTPGGRAVLVLYPGLGLSIALATNCMTLPGDVLGPASQLADLFSA